MKVWWASKALWFNFVSVILTGLEMHFRLLQPLFSETLYGAAAFAIAMVNILLRLVTSQPISFGKQEGEPKE
jgi:hypothetical protein